MTKPFSEPAVGAGEGETGREPSGTPPSRSGEPSRTAAERRRRIGPGWALAKGRFVVLTAGFVVAAVATPFSGAQTVISAFGLVWVGVSALHAVALRFPYRSWFDDLVVPAVDVGFVTAVVAVTDGAESPLRWLLIVAPAVWASARQPHIVLLGTFGAFAYVVGSAGDLTDPHSLRTMVGFLAIYGGATFTAETAARSRYREATLQRTVDDTRQDAEATLLAHARAQQETLVLQLHDGPLQIILAVKHDLEEGAANDTLDRDSLLQDITATIDAMRMLTADLYDGVIGDADLAKSLTQIAEEAGRRGGLPVTVSVGAGCGGHRDALIQRTVRELLANVEKHAQASRAVVTLRALDEPSRLRLIVSDDGKGLHPAARHKQANRRHLGLTSIQHAIDAINGSVEFTALRPGTQITIELPTVPAGHGHR